MSATIQTRRDTATNWDAANPTLADGEFGFVRDTGEVVIGNGSGKIATLLRLFARRTTRTPEMYGAKGDGTTDDQVALQAMVDDLRRGDHVLLQGIYRKSDIIAPKVPETHWDFKGGRFISTNSNRASFQIGPDAWGTKVTNLWNEVDWNGATMVRGGTDILTAGLAAYNTHSLDIDGVTSRFSRQCGTYFSTVKRSRMRNVSVFRSMADSTHFTHNCEDLYLENFVISYSGDDALACVSYLRRGSGASDPAVDPCRRIYFRGLKARYSHARGATILGGENIQFEDLDIAYTRAAGCYMGSESGYQTHTPVNCWMRNGKVTDVGYPIPASGNTADDAALDHGHLFMLSQQGTLVTNCGYEDFEVSGGGPNMYDFCRAIQNGTGSGYSGATWRRIRAHNGMERDAGVYLRMTNTTGTVTERLLDLRSPQNRIVTQAQYDALGSEAKNVQKTWIWVIRG